MSKEYIECNQYTSSLADFDGCAGLDCGADSKECGDCPYRLRKVIEGLAVLKDMQETFRAFMGERRDGNKREE